MSTEQFDPAKSFQWGEMAERDEYKTLTTFERGLHWESGNDGHAHLTYFDKSRQLSFVWDGDVNTPVQVSHGGYGEPISWKFYFNNHRVMDLGEPNFVTLVRLFQRTCEAWIDSKEDAE